MKLECDLMKLKCERHVNKDNFETRSFNSTYGLDGRILWMSLFTLCIISSGESSRSPSWNLEVESYVFHGVDKT